MDERSASVDGERVVVAVTEAADGERLIERAAQLARGCDGELVGVHVRADGEATGPSPVLDARAELVRSLGGTFHEVVGHPPPAAIVDFARSVGARQLVLGSTARSWWFELLHGSTIGAVLRSADDIDVHVVSDRRHGPDRGRLPRPPRPRRPPVPVRRQVLAAGVGIVALVAVTGALLVARDTIELSTVLLLYLVVVCGVAVVGGLVPAAVAAVVATFVGNWFFTEPYHTLRIDDAEQLVALAVLLATGGLVSALVGRAARAAAAAQRSRAEASALAIAAGQLTASGDALAATLAHLRTTFAQETVALLTQVGGRWEPMAAAGGAAPADPGGGTAVAIGSRAVLVLVPGGLAPEDERVLAAFAAQVEELVERRELEHLAQEAEAAARADELRTAILRAVSHDLRSPLASIKASSTSLLQADIEWTAEQRREFALTIDEEADRLDRLIANLLDMSRIEAGAVDPTRRALDVEDTIHAAVADLGLARGAVSVEVAAELPAIHTDPGLLERIVANLVGNAARHAGGSDPVAVRADLVDDRVRIEVVDHGPGVPADRRDRAFDAFQRLGDTAPGAVGLGLAVANGFTTALGGRLTLHETPGGGLTATVDLPADGGSAS